MSNTAKQTLEVRQFSNMPGVPAQLVNVKVFGRLPPEIRDDRRLGLMELNTLALLTTFKSYRLRPKRVRQHFGGRPGTTGQRNGAGIKAIETAIKRLIELGYVREVWRGSKMIHEVTFKCPDAHHIKQAWFDGTLSPHALAALIWLRVNPGAHCREVQERFGWSKRAAQYAMAELRDAGLMEKHKQLRAAAGTFGARTYTARLSAVESVASLPGAANGAHLTECTQRGTYKEDSPLPEGLPVQTGIKHKHVDCSIEPSTRPDDDGSKELLDPDTTVERLWGWLSGCEELEANIIEHECEGAWESYSDLFDEMQQYHLDQILEIMDLSDILKTARRCAVGRINANLPGREVARVIAHIAACILANEYNYVNDPARALQIVFAHIRTRIGSDESCWINNMAIIAKPVLLKCHFDAFAEPEFLSKVGEELLPIAVHLRTLTVQRDQIGMFAKSFEETHDQIAVFKLINQYGMNNVLAAISASIEQATRLRGLRYLTSWQALEEARLANGADVVLAA